MLQHGLGAQRRRVPHALLLELGAVVKNDLVLQLGLRDEKRAALMPLLQDIAALLAAVSDKLDGERKAQKDGPKSG